MNREAQSTSHVLNDIMLLTSIYCVFPMGQAIYKVLDPARLLLMATCDPGVNVFHFHGGKVEVHRGEKRPRDHKAMAGPRGRA